MGPLLSSPVNPALLEELRHYRLQNQKLMDNFMELMKKMQEQNIETFEDLEKYDKKSAETLVKLAAQTPPTPMKGINFGFFGMTSTGKSTIINQLLGSKVAKTGAGETTKEITPYDGRGYRLFDIPGRNDELSYFSMEYVGFWKGLSGRLIVIKSTIKEMSKVVRLLDELKLHYDIVVNKFDEVEADEQESFKNQIRDEIKDLQLKGVDNVWFVSAKNPQQFPDWFKMVDYLTNKKT